MFAKAVWSVWGRVMGLAFLAGLSLIRLSAYRLSRHFDSAGYSWSVDHWSSETCALDEESHAKYAEDFRRMLWFIAEPHPSHAGAVPEAQLLLLKELVASTWTGGRTASVVCLLGEVMAAEDLVVY